MPKWTSYFGDTGHNYRRVVENHRRGAPEPEVTSAVPQVFNEMPDGTRFALWGCVRRDKEMKTKLLAMVLLAAGSLCAATRFSFGVGVGVPAYYPPAPPVVAYAPPVYPAPVYRGAAVVGVPPYAGAYWVAPRYFGGRYYAGYWRHGYVRGFRR